MTLLPNEYTAYMVQIWGEYLGCGKTMTAVEYAYRDHLMTGHAVYSNIHLSFARADPEPLEIVLMRGHRQAILVFDELYQVLEARGSERGRNKKLTDEIAMNRKRGNRIYATSPEITMVDKRFRNIADFTLKTERLGDLNDRTAVIRVYICAKNLKNPSGIEMLTDWYTVDEVCDLYDTREEVQTDRLAYIAGVADIISQKNTILKKMAGSNLALQKAYLNNVFYVAGSSDQLMVLDKLGLLK